MGLSVWVPVPWLVARQASLRGAYLRSGPGEAARRYYATQLLLPLPLLPVRLHGDTPTAAATALPLSFPPCLSSCFLPTLSLYLKPKLPLQILRLPLALPLTPPL